MAISVFATKIEMKAADMAVVSVVINGDLGPMQFDLPVKVQDGDANKVLREAADRLRNFGNELMNAIGSKSLRLYSPPK